MTASTRFPLSMSWQLQGGDWKHVKRSIRAAKAYGTERIQLSHHLMMHAQELWTKDKAGLVNRAIEYAHQCGLKVDVWTHELSGSLEKEKSSWSEWAEIDQWLKAKYQRVFDTIPGADGLVLTLAETDLKIYSDDVKLLSEELGHQDPVERVRRLILIMGEICQLFNKLLIVRTFVYEPKESRAMIKAIRLAKEGLPGLGMVVMSKCVPHDWSPYYPYNFLLGKFTKVGIEEWMEVDLGEEYTGQSKLPHAEVDYLKSALNIALSKRISHVVARIERFDRSALDTPNELNLHCLSQLIQSPELSSEELWKNWAESLYPPECCPNIISAFKRTFDMINLIYFPLQQWVSDHSQMPTIDYVLKSLVERKNCKWIPSPHEELQNQKLQRPSRETLYEIQREKELAVELCEASIEDIISVRTGLESEVYESLLGVFQGILPIIEVFRLHQLSIFGAIYCKQFMEKGVDCSNELSEVKGWIKELMGAHTLQVEEHFEGIFPRAPHMSKRFTKCVDDVREFVRTVNLGDRGAAFSHKLPTH